MNNAVLTNGSYWDDDFERWRKVPGNFDEELGLSWRWNPSPGILTIKDADVIQNRKAVDKLFSYFPALLVVSSESFDYPCSKDEVPADEQQRFAPNPRFALNQYLGFLTVAKYSAFAASTHRGDLSTGLSLLANRYTGKRPLVIMDPDATEPWAVIERVDAHLLDYLVEYRVLALFQDRAIAEALGEAVSERREGFSNMTFALNTRPHGPSFAHDIAEIRASRQRLELDNDGPVLD